MNILEVVLVKTRSYSCIVELVANRFINTNYLLPSHESGLSQWGIVEEVISAALLERYIEKLRSNHYWWIAVCEKISLYRFCIEMSMHTSKVRRSHFTCTWTKYLNLLAVWSALPAWRSLGVEQKSLIFWEGIWMSLPNKWKLPWVSWVKI